MGAGWGGVQQLKGGGQMRDVSGHKGEASLGCRGGGAAAAHIANFLGGISCSWCRTTEETQSYLLSHRWTPWVPDKRSWGCLKQGVLKGLGALTPLVKRQDGAGATPLRCVPLPQAAGPRGAGARRRVLGVQGLGGRGPGAGFWVVLGRVQEGSTRK